eukprot:2999970-Prymnesium_polylepis.1
MSREADAPHSARSMATTATKTHRSANRLSIGQCNGDGASSDAYEPYMFLKGHGERSLTPGVPGEI